MCLSPVPCSCLVPANVQSPGDMHCTQQKRERSKLVADLTSHDTLGNIQYVSGLVLFSSSSPSPPFPPPPLGPPLHHVASPAECPQVLSNQYALCTGERVCTRTGGVWSHLHVPLPSHLANACLPLQRVPDSLSCCCCHHAHGDEQLGPRSGASEGGRGGTVRGGGASVYVCVHACACVCGMCACMSTFMHAWRV